MADVEKSSAACLPRRLLERCRGRTAAKVASFSGKNKALKLRFDAAGVLPDSRAGTPCGNPYHGRF